MTKYEVYKGNEKLPIRAQSAVGAAVSAVVTVRLSGAVTVLGDKPHYCEQLSELVSAVKEESHCQYVYLGDDTITVEMRRVEGG